MYIDESVKIDVNNTAVFVMPVFLDGGEQSLVWLNQTVKSVLTQTDPNWRLVMVNDASPLPSAAAELARLQAQDARLHVITNKTNHGAGVSRNIGIQWAHDNGHPFILFLDSDDMAHPKRVATVRSIMLNDPAASVVYSTFTVIDEAGDKVAPDKLSGSILEILECHSSKPPQGENALVEIATVTGYANLTSSTAVRTELAINQPFPHERAVEDAHAWFRYAAAGQKFIYTPRIPALYRIPQTAADSSMRDRLGGVNVYYKAQCDIERDGFKKALYIAIQNGKIKKSERERLLAGYHVRMAESMRRVNQMGLAAKEISRANAVSRRFTNEWIALHGYSWAKEQPDSTLAISYQQALEE